MYLPIVNWNGIGGGALGGGVELSAACSFGLVFRLPFQVLPLVASRLCSEPSLDHCVTLVALARWPRWLRSS